MNKTVKMLIGITAGLALLLGPTAVYAGKGNKNKEKGKGSQTVKVKSESEVEKKKKTETNEDSFNDTKIKDSGNDNRVGNCGVAVLSGCGKNAGGLIGGKEGVANDLLKEGIELDEVLENVFVLVDGLLI